MSPLSKKRRTVTIGLKQASPLAQTLGCKINKSGGAEIESFGRTNMEGVYVSLDSSLSKLSRLIIAASEGSKIALGVIKGLIDEDF
jgi:alkyl hydroperoxide reductase subunit AhpF